VERVVGGCPRGGEEEGGGGGPRGGKGGGPLGLGRGVPSIGSRSKARTRSPI
jgi:hypothetical protein